MLERFRTIRFAENFDMVVAVANGGIIPAAILNQRLGVEFNLLKINYRDNFQKPLYASPKLLSPIDFEFKGKKILVVEDRVKTGASLETACKFLDGAALVKTFAVNGKADYSLYDEDCFLFSWCL
ncbi:MAG: phosphoribosyltransferase [Prevotellaceae bacterium]|jgi:hypoxanthine phosphoribosyltransferase|nr:phosphoribosyltransferase [Prevotellaceae bacterium]